MILVQKRRQNRLFREGSLRTVPPCYYLSPAMTGLPGPRLRRTAWLVES